MLVSFFWVLGAFAQQQGSVSELVARAEKAIENNQDAAAVPILKQIVDRLSSAADDSAKQGIQIARLQLAQSSLKLFNLSDARKYAGDYLANEPNKEKIAAMHVLCQVALLNEDWDELKKTVDEMMSHSLRIKEMAAAIQFKAQAMFGLGEYNEALELLSQALESVEDEQNRLTYKLMKIRCLTELDRMDEFLRNFPDMFSGESRFNVELNMTLLGIGDQLLEQEEYRKALAMYQLVIPKAEIRQHLENQLPTEDAVDLDRVEDYDLHLAYQTARVYDEQSRIWEAVALYGLLYDQHPDTQEGLGAMLAKIGLLLDVDAEEEAISEGVAFLEKNRSDMFARNICVLLAQHYLEQNAFNDARDLVRYVDAWQPPANEPQEELEAYLRYLFGFASFQLGDYDRAERAFERVFRLAPRSQSAMGAGYWYAMCSMMQQRYGTAYNRLTDYRQNWPDGTFSADALFRAGVCLFGLERYQDAQAVFEQFIDTYPDNNLTPEALSMYGDLLGGEGELDLAMAQYDQAISIVEKKFKEHDDPALKDQLMAAATYAVLQAAKTLKADAEAYAEQGEPETVVRKYRQIIEWMERYQDSFGEYADWPQSVYWIGKAQRALGNPVDAVQSYLDAVLKRGSDPAQEGIASILSDMAGMMKRSLSEDRFEAMVETIKVKRDRTDSPTLKIRLNVLLAELDGTQADLGRRLLESEPDLNPVPPSGLALMCKAMLAQQDYSRAQEIYDYFERKYEDSPFRVFAFQLLGLDLYNRQKTDQAYDIAGEALGYYGATPNTGWAQLLKGKVELGRGNYEAAIKTLSTILNVREWRGPIEAEAMFRMAESWEKSGNIEKAFSFYQRTYLLYKSYDEGRWAAEGYLKSAEMLRKLGRESDVRNTYRAMLLDSHVKDLPQAEQAKKVLGPIETSRLLAGETNLTETAVSEEPP